MSGNNYNGAHKKKSLAKDQLSNVLKENENRLNKMIKEIDKKIFLFSVSIDAISVTQYINLVLYKISVQCAWMVFINQYGEVILPIYINRCIKWLGDVFTMQEKVRKHTAIVLTNNEIKENYRYWSIVKDGFLHTLLIKENYILLQLEMIFKNKKEDMSLLCDVYCRFATGVQSFINIEEVLRNKSVFHNHLCAAKQNLYYCVVIYSKAASMCLELFKTDRRKIILIERTGRFFLVCEHLSKQVGEMEKAKAFKKKETVAQQMLHKIINKQED